MSHKKFHQVTPLVVVALLAGISSRAEVGPRRVDNTVWELTKNPARIPGDHFQYSLKNSPQISLLVSRDTDLNLSKFNGAGKEDVYKQMASGIRTAHKLITGESVEISSPNHSSKNSCEVMTFQTGAKIKVGGIKKVLKSLESYFFCKDAGFHTTLRWSEPGVSNTEITLAKREYEKISF